MPSERWTLEQYKEFRRSGRAPNNTAVRATDMEQNPVNELARTTQDKKVSEKYRINVHRYSAKLCDPDNIASKWSVDALELAGIIPEDSPEYIEAVTFQQTKCKRSEERTVITVYGDHV